MITVCWAAKGGSGTTVFAASTAIALPEPTLLVDLAGDVPSALGLPEPETPGVLDWLRSTAPSDRLSRLELAAARQLTVLPRGSADGGSGSRWDELGSWLSRQPRHVVIDAGTGPLAPQIAALADRALLVTRACYLALRAAMRDQARPSGVVLLTEPGRALTAADIETCLGAPVIAAIPVEPAVARAVDAGLLLARMPGAFRRSLLEVA
jgi:MinD superfamily P-loop ATPase